MAKFGRNLAHITDVFPPAPGAQAQKQPGEVLSGVHPTVDIIGSSRLREAIIEVQTVTGASTTTPTLTGPAKGFFRLWLYLGASHNDSSARRIQFRLISPASQTIVLNSDNDSSAAIASSGGAATRKVIQLPDWTLVANFAFLGAGQVGTLVGLAVELPMGEVFKACEL